MGTWQGINYEEIPPPEDPQQASTQQRRAEIYRRIKELGHPSLFDSDDKEHYARKFDISYRQVNYDIEAVAEFVEETLGDQHVMDVNFVFEKAMSEAINDGEWQEAADIAMQQAEWLERRGVLDKEPDQVEHEVTWRQFVEAGDPDSDTSVNDIKPESGELDVQPVDEA